MNPTPTEVKEFAPEFASVLDARVQLFIDYAAPQLSEDVFGETHKLAVILLTCHMLAMSTQAGSAGSAVVNSEKVGDLQRTFSSSTMTTTTELGMTRFGSELQRLKRQILKSPIVSGG